MREQLGAMFGVFVGTGATVGIVEAWTAPPLWACAVLGCALVFVGAKVGQFLAKPRERKISEAS